VLHLKGLAKRISLLYATLAGWFISVAAKGLKATVGRSEKRKIFGLRDVTRHFA
jgi:hypothetical protein